MVQWYPSIFLYNHHGDTIILAISCPYSRAEHIPCQNSWEISGNCEDPFQVKFVFHTVCQVLLFFWHVRCRLHMFFRKEDPYFQQFLEMYGNVIINNVELSKNGLIMFLWEFVIYTFQDLKTQFISFKLNYVLARLAGLSPAAPSPSFLTSLWPRKEPCTTGSRNTNHRRSCFLPCKLIPPIEYDATPGVR